MSLIALALLVSAELRSNEFAKLIPITLLSEVGSLEEHPDLRYFDQSHLGGLMYDEAVVNSALGLKYTQIIALYAALFRTTNTLQ